MNAQSSLRRASNMAISAITLALGMASAHAADFPCQTWSKGSFDGDRTQSRANTDWITGHLKGLDTGAKLIAIAHGAPQHATGHANPVQARTWIDLYCKANPASDVENAALKYWLQHSYMRTPSR